MKMMAGLYKGDDVVKKREVVRWSAMGEGSWSSGVCVQRGLTVVAR